MGIRAKLVFCLLAVLIPLCAVSVFAFHLFDRQLRERTASALVNTQRIEALRISEILAGYSQDARNLADEPYLQESVARIDRVRSRPTQAHQPSPTNANLKTLAALQVAADWPLQQLATELQNKAGSIGSAISDLRIVNREGLTLGETMSFSWQPTDATLIERSMKSVKTIFGDAYLTNLKEQRLGLVSPIVSRAGEVVGALVIETRLVPITDILSMHEQTGASTEALLVQATSTGDAQLITSLRFNRTSAFSKVLPASKNLPINLALDAETSRLIEAPDYRGINSVQSIQTIPATGWGLVVKIDQQEAYAPLRELRSLLKIAAAISLLLILAGYTIFLGPIARRLKRTAQAAHKITNGDLTVRVCDFHNDEIGNMARTIDTLALQLEQDQRRRKDIEDQLRHQATHDELTGLLNRKYANKLIEQLSEDKAQTHSVMFLDLNGFKDVNDFFGHSIGDEVLSSVAAKLLQLVPRSATLARWGGDEFVIILPRTDLISAEIFSSSVHTAFDSPISTSEGSHQISTSIGLSASNPGKPLQEALIEADLLMYEEKKKLKPNRSIQSLAARTLERALLEDRIELWYEPIVKCNSDGQEKLHAAEVKIRIRTSEGGIVLPDELLNELGNTPLAAELYGYALTTCVKSVTRWIDTNIVSPSFHVHIELTNDMLQNQLFMNTALAFLRTEGKLISKHITLNVNSIAETDLASIKQLKAAGLSISATCSDARRVDSQHDLRFHPDLIKADVIWLNDEISERGLSAGYFEKDLEVCVSGISSRQQIHELTAFGAKLFQGKLFDNPLRAVDFVSRWGQPSTNSLIPPTNAHIKLRLIG